MSVAVCPGEGIGPLSRARRRAIAALGWVLLASACLVPGALWSPAVRAMQTVPAGMYRCQDSHGGAVFTSRPAKYTHCKAIDVKPQADISGGARNPVAGGKPHATPRHGAVVLRGSVYRVVQADGSVEYTNVRPAHRRGRKVVRLFNYIDTCVACAVDSPINWQTVPLDLATYRKAVQSAAKAYGVKPAFLRAVIHAESAFDPDAVSGKGAQGLMQLMPATASSMGVADAFDATQNIRGGARYLAQLLHEFHGDHALAAAAYNAGPSAVQKYDGVPPYTQTRVYVKRVDILYKRYTKALAAGKHASGGS